MRFTINIATRTYLDYRRVNQAGVIIIATLLGLLAWNVSRMSWNFGDLRRLKAESAVFEGRLGSRPAGVSEKEYTRMQASIRFYNDVIERKSYSWLGLLDLLENVTPEGVALVSLAPDKKVGDLKIDGRARNFGAVRTYMDKMEDSRTFTDILLLSHTEVAAGNNAKGVLFKISCRAVLP